MSTDSKNTDVPEKAVITTEAPKEKRTKRTMRIVITLETTLGKSQDDAHTHVAEAIAEAVQHTKKTAIRDLAVIDSEVVSETATEVSEDDDE